MDRSKKGKKSRQENFMDDEAVVDVEERKPERNPKGKNYKDRNAKKGNVVSDEEDAVKKPAKTNQKTAAAKGHSRRVDSDEEESVESDTDWKQPSKQTKNTAGGKNKNQPAASDEESGNSDDEKKVTSKQMKSNVKKKNKKESREEEEIKEIPKVDSNDVKSNQKKDKKGGPKNSQKKKQEESDEDDDEIDENEVVPKKGTQMKKPTFQMLAMESSEDEKEDEEESDESFEVKKSDVVNQKKGKKAKQNKKKAKPAEDEDIDKLVAEISNMSTTSLKKKGDKKKDQAVKEEKSDIHVVEAKPEVVITSNMTQEELYKLMDEMAVDDDDKPKAKKKKGKQQESSLQQQQESAKLGEGKEGSSDEEDEGEETLTIKSTAQKKKEKKERQKAEKQKKTEVKGKEKVPAVKEEKESAEKVPEGKEDLGKEQEDKNVADKKKELTNEKETEDQPAQEQTKEPGEAEEAKASKKDKKKKKDDKDKEKEKAKKPSKMVQEILERQKRIKEEEERLQREEEERIRKEEEAIRLKEEEERRIKERKEKLKQKKKEKIERKKQEGTFLTEKQKEDKRRLMHMLEIYHKEIPDEVRAAAAEKKPPKYEKKKPKQNRQTSVEGKDSGSALTSPVDDTTVEPVLMEPEMPEPTESTVEEKEDVKDAWDMSSADEEEEEEAEKKVEHPVATVTRPKEEPKHVEQENIEEPSSEEEEETSEEEDSEESEESSSEDDGKTPHEKAREKALAKIQKRKEDAEAKRSLDKLRAPVVCVLGHVDTGKTKILDKLRRTNVQDCEAGGITQQIGATNVPQETIKEQTKMCKEFQKQELKLPGLLIIDTPGHESFSNLRSRGSSLCDIAILVVDIMHGLEPQTIESMNLLKARKTPFVVALNKVDRLYGWQTNPHSDIINTLNRQKPNTRMEFNDRTKEVIVQFAEQGLNATLFHENKNPREYISLVPTSAHTGDGMGNLIALICELTQNMLAKRLMFSEELKATVMEVKTLHGLGTTIDVILVNGCLHESDTIVVAGQEGPIVTQIRALLMPQPLRELRVKGQYEHHKEVFAAQGCKIVAKDLEKALAGLPLFVAPESDEAEIYKEELSQMLKDVLGDVKVSDKGVYVQASTLGSLEALLQFLKTSEIPFAGINIGPVHKKDIMKASVMLEHDPQYAVILAFDVKVEHEAQAMADSLGVRIFTADIIYHLFDSFTKYREDFKRQKREEFKHVAVFPCKLRIMPQYIFNSRDPIVMGVIVEAGFLKEGTLLCVPSKEFVEVGRVSSIEVNHKPVERATKGQEVCVKIDPIPGEAPKMFGRHFDATDFLVSKISRQSIDAVKNYFREEMSKTDWQLIMELKKTFEIL